MQITAIQNYRYNTYRRPIQTHVPQSMPVSSVRDVSFCALNPVTELKGFLAYKRAQKYADRLLDYVNNEVGADNFAFRYLNVDILEGLQYNIKAFKGLTMKEIQYLSENLHVIAVKRGCTHMCGHCYADAKPSRRQMSYEDFHTITGGFKTLRKRLHGLDIYWSNNPMAQQERIYKTTELFYDADCMDIVLKDKKGKEYDFIELANELYDSLGRQTVFDTSGWDINNKKLQERAFKYAAHFSSPENMEKLAAFNVSFNVFNASYIASRKALQAGDIEKAARLRNKFTTNMANTLFTFTPVAEHPNFGIMLRSFRAFTAKHSKGFNEKDMVALRTEVLRKLDDMFRKDFEGEKRYIKVEADIKKYMALFNRKMDKIDTRLNSSGRMADFVKEHGIVTTAFQDHSKTTPIIIDSLKESARKPKTILMRLIDADGKVYHMDYARFIPTEIQLNISGKNKPTPTLANLVKNFVITRENLNK